MKNRIPFIHDPLHTRPQPDPALYILIAIGWAAGRFYGVARESLANLVLFVIMPVMVFGFVVTLDLKPKKAATTVLIGTIFALLWIPLALSVMQIY